MHFSVAATTCVENFLRNHIVSNLQMAPAAGNNGQPEYAGSGPVEITLKNYLKRR